LPRRESVELALYTFKYVPNTDSVVVFLPPPAGQNPTWAMLFCKSDFAPHLAAPLTHTLSDPPPNPTSLARSSETTLVETLTAAGASDGRT
jgi:hypothetical protein